jgi:hypothetical protein
MINTEADAGWVPGATQRGWAAQGGERAGLISSGQRILEIQTAVAGRLIDIDNGRARPDLLSAYELLQNMNIIV